MKQFLLIATLLLTFGFAGAQSTVSTIDKYGYNKTAFMMIEGDKVYNIDKHGYNKVSIAQIEGGRIYRVDKYGYNKKLFMLVEGGKIYTVDKYGYNKTVFANRPRKAPRLLKPLHANLHHLQQKRRLAQNHPHKQYAHL